MYSVDVAELFEVLAPSVVECAQPSVFEVRSARVVGVRLSQTCDERTDTPVGLMFKSA